MPLILNAFKANLDTTEYSLPCLDYQSWEESTQAKTSGFAGRLTWRYTPNSNTKSMETNLVRMVFLDDAPVPGSVSEAFDIGIFPRIGMLLIENALERFFEQRQFRIERTKFQTYALRPVMDSLNDAIELASGISYSVKRPFRDQPYEFAVNLNWEVRAHFRDSLADKSLARIALGMPVIYQPQRAPAGKLASFQNRYLGRIRSIEHGHAVVMSRDDSEPLRIPLVDLRLEANPAVIKQYEQSSVTHVGPSSVLRRIQQLKHSYTSDNRRNASAFKDRLEDIRMILGTAGTSANQIVLPISTSRDGSVSISTQPMEITTGGLW